MKIIWLLYFQLLLYKWDKWYLHWFSKCSLGTRSISIAWEFVRNVRFQTRPQPSWITRSREEVSTLSFNDPPYPGGSDSCSSVEAYFKDDLLNYKSCSTYGKRNHVFIHCTWVAKGQAYSRCSINSNFPFLLKCKLPPEDPSRWGRGGIRILFQVEVDSRVVKDVSKCLARCLRWFPPRGEEIRWAQASVADDSKDCSLERGSPYACTPC